MTCYNLAMDIQKQHDILCEIRPATELRADLKIQYYSGGEAPAYRIGAGLKLDPESNTLSVDMADAVEQDNTRPITSAAVYTTVGNIDALLATL